MLMSYKVRLISIKVKVDSKTSKFLFIYLMIKTSKFKLFISPEVIYYPIFRMNIKAHKLYELLYWTICVLEFDEVVLFHTHLI